MLSDIEIANAAILRRSGTSPPTPWGSPRSTWCPTATTRPRSTSATSPRWPTGRWAAWSWSPPCPPRRPARARPPPRSGSTDALHGLGHRTIACLREPSMGPVFGMKGGAAGGGYSQVVPMTEINLHFTGDFAAIAAANNLLAALIDNHVHHGNELDIDVRSVTWKRVLDTNDRALREVVVGPGRARQRLPPRGRLRHRRGLRADGDLLPHRVLGRPQAAHRRHRRRLHPGHGPGHRARASAPTGAMAVLLRDALAPNLVQTLEGAPAFVHGGPFANIAHGCSSVMATRAGLRLADIVVTEAGFGADLGAEKFVDIKCRKSGLRPDAGRRGGHRARPEVPRRRRAGRPRHRGRRRRRGRHGQPAPAPRQRPRRLRHPVRRRGQPLPHRHRPRGRRGSSSWWRTRASRPTRPPTSPTAASARRTSPRACWRRWTSRRRTTSPSPTTTTSR